METSDPLDYMTAKKNRAAISNYSTSLVFECWCGILFLSLIIVVTLVEITNVRAGSPLPNKDSEPWRYQPASERGWRLEKASNTDDPTWNTRVLLRGEKADMDRDLRMRGTRNTRIAILQYGSLFTLLAAPILLFFSLIRIMRKRQYALSLVYIFIAAIAISFAYWHNYYSALNI